MFYSVTYMRIEYRSMGLPRKSINIELLLLFSATHAEYRKM